MTVRVGSPSNPLLQRLVSSSPHSIHRVRSRLATAIAVLCLIAQALPLLHLLLVPHARCELHGETIHVSEGEPAHGPITTVPAADGTASSIQSSDTHADGHEHDHCQVLSDRRDATCARAEIVSAIPSTMHDIEHGRPASPAISLRLYRLAPKLSPPRTV